MVIGVPVAGFMPLAIALGMDKTPAPKKERTARSRYASMSMRW